jgi:hypothetical protein
MLYHSKRHEIGFSLWVFLGQALWRDSKIRLFDASSDDFVTVSMHTDIEIVWPQAQCGCGAATGRGGRWAAAVVVRSWRMKGERRRREGFGGRGCGKRQRLYRERPSGASGCF